MVCNEKVINWKDVNPEQVPEDKAKGTTIRWIFKHGETPTFLMRIFEVEPGGEIYDHSHPWEHEIFILSGKGVIRIDGREYEVKEGDAIYIPPCKTHYYKNTGDDVLRFICLIPKEGK
ncbi:cupin domain-containing protein [Ignicoccus islandicus]|uniref:cupin domain-containing protein n=1 Tax=Ignicoccus islandicus TaxID=54259 RepID=UPI00094650A7|nr:cupin domain-containing protein [Ignicoccus islandicus]